MIRFWHLPPHINENKLPDPFTNLLDDEATTSTNFTIRFKKAREWTTKAQQLANKALKSVENSEVEVMPGVELPIERGPKIRASDKKVVTVKNLYRPDTPLKEVREAQSFMNFARKGDEQSMELIIISQIKTLIRQTVIFINQVDREGISYNTEHAILSSSWLYAGIVSWSQGHSFTETIYEDRLSTLVTKISSLLINPITPLLGQQSLLCLRRALLLLPERVSVAPKDNTTGTLSLRIIKRYNPRRAYGPYKYPNVPNTTWKEMQSAVGMYGTGAGTIFWRRYLDRFYSKRTTGNRRFN